MICEPPKIRLTMTPIDLEAEYIDDFTSLTEEVNDTRLVHINGIQFAILGPLNTILFAFESIALAAYVRDARPDFTTFRFAQTRTAAGAGPDDQKILLIWVANQSGIMLDEHDALTLLEHQGPGQTQPKLASANKAFGLPPKGHLARILMTERLIKRVESISEGHDPTIEQILYLMYREFVKTRRSESDRSDGQLVPGEHFIFETRPFNDQLTIFDLTDLT